MKGVKSVRCAGATKPTPFLSKNIAALIGGRDHLLEAVDLGCGNGRNSDFLKSHGMMVYSFDTKPDYGLAVHLGHEDIPVHAKSMDVVLANYIFMFLTKPQINHLLNEINRVAKDGCRVLVEMEDVKQGEWAGEDATAELEALVKTGLMEKHFCVVKENKHRFIMQKY
jgi:SAM-dependent methyltransferase